MANANAPYGFRPVGTLNAASYSGQIRKFAVPADNATAIFIGDTVVMAGTSDAMAVYPQDVLTPEVAVGAATSKAVGVCVGIEPVYSDLTINYRKASTFMYIYVDVDPNTIYSVQGDSTVWTVADIGCNATLTATAGDTATGRSKFVITAPTADAAKACLIVGVDPDPNNVVGVYWKMLVRLNLHQFGTAIVGIS
jgi:hypothetical protein